MKTLKDSKIGDTVKVLKVNGEGAIRRRIMDMGITKHAEIYVKKVAPLGDPIEITVRGYELTLRKEDANKIEVEDSFELNTCGSCSGCSGFGCKFGRKKCC